MVKFTTAVTTLAGLLSTVSAFGGNFTNSFEGIRVGQLVKLTWKLNDPAQPIGRVTLLHQYEAGGLNVAQIETVARKFFSNAVFYFSSMCSTTSPMSYNVELGVV